MLGNQVIEIDIDLVAQEEEAEHPEEYWQPPNRFEIRLPAHQEGEEQGEKNNAEWLELEAFHGVVGFLSGCWFLAAEQTMSHQAIGGKKIS